MWFIKRCDTTHHHFTSGLFQGEGFKGFNPENFKKKKGKKGFYMKEFVTTLR